MHKIWLSSELSAILYCNSTATPLLLQELLDRLLDNLCLCNTISSAFLTKSGSHFLGGTYLFLFISVQHFSVEHSG